MLGRMWRGTLLHSWWECKLVQPLWKTVWSFLKKLKIELPQDPTIALLGIYPKDTNVLIQRGTFTTVFIAAMSTIAKLWKEPRWPTTDKWLKKMWYIYTIKKKMKSCHLQQCGWNQNYNAEQNKSSRERQLSNDFTPTWNRRKSMENHRGWEVKVNGK